MPKKKRATRSNKNDSIMTIRSDANSTVMSVRDPDSTLTSVNLNESGTSMWYTDGEEKLQLEITRRKDILNDQLENFDLEFKTILLKIPKNVLNKIIYLSDVKLHKALSSVNLNVSDSDSSEPSICSPIIPTTVKKPRRSRSASKQFTKPEAPKEPGSLRRTTRVRSSSVDMYQTPRNRARLSAFTTAKKYTVSKPKKVEDSGINMRRFMRPDEEAISTSGSPLYVHSSVASTPHVNIPLPGGVVLNIEPKRPRGPLEVPELDEKTRKQLKILCEQLNLIADQ